MKTIITILTILAFAFGAYFYLEDHYAIAEERINLTTPITYPSVTYYSISSLGLYWSAQKIEVYLCHLPTNEVIIIRYFGEEALNLMKIMNTKNFSTTSMQKTILEKLINDGKISGTISGSPD